MGELAYLPLLARARSSSTTVRIAAFATQGSGSGDEARIVALLDGLEPEVWAFDRSRKLNSLRRLLIKGLRDAPDLVVMEGTGIVGGMAVLGLRAGGRVRFVISSGDAVGPYLAARSRPAGLLGALYERALYRASSGFIGWTPYLAGRALTLGSPRAMTAAGWAAHSRDLDARQRIRAQLGIAPDAVVFGIVGSIVWRARRGYCYGHELVRAIERVERDDVQVLIVGDGSGLAVLRRAAAGHEDRVHFAGRVDPGCVSDYLSAMDVASLPQSLDGVGAFRYSTKLPEYLAAGLPVVTGQLPFAYDLDDGWVWRLPGEAPWDERYVSGLAELMAQIDHAAVTEHGARVPSSPLDFDLARQQVRVRSFIEDLVAGGSG